MIGALSFKIRKNPSGQGSIQAQYRLGTKIDVRLSTGKKIKSFNNWNNQKQRVKNVASEIQAAAINRWLTEKQLEIENSINELEFSNPLFNTNHISSILRTAFNKSNASDKALTTRSSNRAKSLIDAYTWYIDHFSVHPTPTTQKPLAASSVKSFKATKKKFIEFCSHSKNYDYHDIDMGFYEKFVSWLQSKNFSTNYIGSHIKNLKTIMNYTHSLGYHNNLAYKKREFAKPKEEVQSIFLNETELEKIFKLKLNKSLGHSRDIFLIGAYTGLRISDLNRLTAKNIIEIDNSKFIEIKPLKTGNRITIPCNSKVLKILSKYGGDPPTKKLDQHINRDLKIIGAKAKIKDKIFITKTTGGITKVTEYLKYNLITTHTARRSFCTNAYNAGMQTFDIMNISGHKTERVFYEYIKATDQDKAKKIAEHPFFK
ncbi:tyrosine-type recombinase/integrase [Nonlabens ulvanivorans]|uniref:tyrosine-type recombinase/integrase n=1 Tax=Nonlabens ulvanivorans TaxID=906888 RepID=UPI0037C96FFB